LEKEEDKADLLVASAWHGVDGSGGAMTNMWGWYTLVGYREEKKGKEKEGGGSARREEED
jgi:hypothetical protein